MSNIARISLHLGVHKTATTHTQSRLLNSINELRSAGVDYIELGLLRNKVTKHLSNGNISNDEIIKNISDYLNCKRLVISDENIIGVACKPTGKKLYSGAVKTFSKLWSALSDYEVDVYITLRDFSDYIVSRYSESLRHYPYVSFEEYLNEISLDDLRWLPLLEDLYGVMNKPIFVNDFSFVLDGDRYLETITGVKVSFSDAAEGPEIRRPKISNEMHTLLEIYDKLYSKKTTMKFMRFLDSHPQDLPATRFMPLTENEIEILKSRYMQELKNIQNDSRFIFLE